MHAEFIRSATIEGKTVNRLIGNVQLSHNEAVMSCDSAYLHPGNHFDAFGHIVIVQKGTRLYGETLHYDGNTSIGEVRGKIVRLVDSAAVLRTFNLDFNTKQNVGYFYGGGTLANKDNVLESDKGYYYSGQKLARFEGAVEMRNKEYEIYSDSLHYYTNTETAIFLGPTSIWHKDGYLSCEGGRYERKRDYFHFSKNAYVMSDKQEMWADSIFYDRRLQVSDLYGNIQLLDTTRSLLSFADEAHLVDSVQDVLMTRHPSVAYYEMDKEGKCDTLFLRADTLHFVAFKNPAFYAKDSAAADSLAPVAATDVLPDTLWTLAALPRLSGCLPDILPKIPYVPKPHPGKAADMDPGVTMKEGTLPLPADSLLAAADTLPPKIDSVFRYMYGYRNVRFFRSDGQGACDSLVYFVNDSIGEMFYRPVLWNGNNQVSSELIRFVTERQQLDKVEFLGSAFIAAQEDTAHYNQVKGRDMYAYFRNNEMYLLDVLSNVQSVFYMVEDSVITSINLGESTNMQVDVKERKISRVKYIDKPVIDVHPLGLVSREKQRLKGFNWREAQRPQSRYDVCDRLLKDSRRKAVAEIVKPGFPITKKIDGLK